MTYIWRFHDLAPPIRPLRIAAVFTVASWAFLAVSPNLPVLRRGLQRPFVMAMLGWSVWLVLGVPFALDSGATWDFIVTTQVKNFALFLFLLGALGSMRSLRLVILAQVTGAIVAAAFYIKAGMPLWGTPLRMYDVNDMAFLLNMTLPFVVWAALDQRSRAIRLGLWVSAAGLVLAVTGTQSRGGLLALGAVVGFMFLRGDGFSKAVKIRVLAMVGLLLLASPAAYWDRMSTMLDLESDYNLTSEVGRIAIWKRGIGYATDRPFVGLGASNFPRAEGMFRPEALAGLSTRQFVAHSSYVEIAAENGLVGVAWWLSMIALAFGSLERLRSRLKTAAKAGAVRSVEGLALVDACQASLLAYCVGGAFLSMGYMPYLLVLVAFIGGLQYVLIDSAAAVAPARRTGPRRMRSSQRDL